MSNTMETPVRDVDFDNPESQKKRINYKEVFLTMNEGDNLVRFIDLKGKKIGTHWIKDINGKQRSVKCPVTGCPCCKNNVQTQYKTFMKVFDKAGNIRILEFGSQIMNQLKRIVNELKEEDPNATLTQRDIIISRGPQGSSPLYNVKLVKLNPKPGNLDILRQNALEEAIAKDTLELSEIVTPWTVDRINQYIYGIGADGQPVSTEAVTPSVPGANQVPSVPSQKSAPEKVATASSVNSKNGEDLSMFE